MQRAVSARVIVGSVLVSFVPAQTPNNDDRASGSPYKTILAIRNVTVGVPLRSFGPMNVHVASANGSPATALVLVVPPATPAKSVVGPSSSAPAPIMSARPRAERAHTPWTLPPAQVVPGHVPVQLASARLFTRRGDAMTAAPRAIVTQTPGTAALALTTTTPTPAIADFGGELPADALAVASEGVVAEANQRAAPSTAGRRSLAERFLRRAQMKETVAESLFQARRETNADVGCIAVPRSSVVGRRGKLGSSRTTESPSPEPLEPLERSGALQRLQRSDGNPCSTVSVVPDCPYFDWYTRCALEARRDLFASSRIVDTSTDSRAARS